MKTVLTVSVGLAALSIAHAAAAQDLSRPDADSPATDVAKPVDEIVVTGSRIARPNLEQPAPVSVLTADAIAAKGTPILGDALAQLPSLGFTGGVRGNAFGVNGPGTSGLDLADLHDLGVSRTLVLVDGKRHVAGSGGTAAVDLSSIPPGMVDHVEVITGGASAVYGSDAVSGVVNVLTRKRFDGLSLNLQSGTYTEGFGASWSGDATAGHNFRDGNGNITVSAFASRQAPVSGTDVPVLRPGYFRVLNPADLNAGGVPISGNGIPNQLIVANSGIDILNDTGVLVDLSTGRRPITFDAAANLVRFPDRIASLNFAIGAFAAPCTACYRVSDFVPLVPQVERAGGAVRFDRALTDGIRLTLDGKFVQATTTESGDTDGSILSVQLTPDNAYITPQLAAYLASTPASAYPYISRRFADVGPETTRSRRRTWRGVAQLDGAANAGFADVRWDVSANYGRTDSHIRFDNLLFSDRVTAALDAVRDAATGQIVCRSRVAGCVPYNPFGMQNGAAAIDYVRATGVQRQRITQLVFDANAAFDTARFLTLPGGPVRIATGAEYRRETSRITYDQTLQSGLTTFGAPVDASGDFAVAEAYLEAEAPLLKDRPFFRELALDGAIRVSHYDTIGNTTAWKIGGLWAPVSFLKARATYSRAVRAPNITELFLPATGGFANINDPCDISLIGNNAVRTANCRAAGVPVGYSQGTTNIAAATTGNAGLSPEVSNSLTAGIILEPVRNLAVTIDYFDIDIRDAISFVSAQNITNFCYDAVGGIDNRYCSLIARNASTRQLAQVSTSYVNASRLKTNGIDAQLSYRTAAPAPGGVPATIGLSLNGTYVFRLRNYPFQDNPAQVNILEGFAGRPQFKALASLNYDAGRFGAMWQTRYASRQARFSKDPGQAAYEELFDQPYLGARTYHNVALSYRIGGEGRPGMTIRGGVNNLFDAEPPIFSLTGFGRDGVYDLGRYAYVGANLRF